MAVFGLWLPAGLTPGAFLQRETMMTHACLLICARNMREPAMGERDQPEVHRGQVYAGQSVRGLRAQQRRSVAVGGGDSVGYCKIARGRAATQVIAGNQNWK